MRLDRSKKLLGGFLHPSLPALCLVACLFHLIVFGSNPPSALAFTTPSSALKTKQLLFQYRSSHLGAFISSSEAVDILHQSQTNTVSKISSSIPDLTAKPNLSWTEATVNGNPSSLDGRDAPGPSNIAWLASVHVANQLSSLTIFNGPLTNVPHLLSRCIVNGNDNTLNFALDFRPRAYGAYEMKDEAGNYPGPEVLGREAFTYSGNRKEFESNFGTPQVQSFLQSTLASFQGGATVVDAREMNEYERIVAGPL
jgi:hypothetical protein